MNKREETELYCGILANYPAFQTGERAALTYDFDCPEYRELIERYGLEKLAGRGGEFTRARRLMRYLAPRLTHESNYDGHVACNALALLDYSLDQPEHGINCLYKSKVLAECCLALGIPARRVVIMPFSPYDLDNHVVTEIFDRERDKWIMLDPTTNGYFVDESGTPLSMAEIRERFAALDFVTYTTGRSRLDLVRQREKYARQNRYLCKNAFYFILEKYNGFGAKNEWLCLIPEGFSQVGNQRLNLEYRLKNEPQEILKKTGEKWRAALKRMENAADCPIDSSAYLKKPI